MGALLHVWAASSYLSEFLNWHDVNLRTGVHLEFCSISLDWQLHIAFIILDLNFSSDGSYKQGWVEITFVSCSSSCARPCTFFRAHALEGMLFLTVVTFLAIYRTLSYAMSGSTVPTIEHLDCRNCRFPHCRKMLP